MHATKPINGPTPTSQLKCGSDNVQTATSIHSQTKGRKRERVDQSSEPIKRECSLKADDYDSVQYRSESILKFEISRITEKGGLVNSEGVEKLVQLMQLNRDEKKLEILSRSMFADVIAATENFDCLSQFVQLKGLPVLDRWLQDIHKGKIGDGSPKEIDKSTEIFLFTMLRALDKLPVNLQALQMCNIGKSVNHLRTYKNSEIQKKARSLVDTWKKRVEAEMNVIGTKSGSNQAVSCASRSHLPEGSMKSATHISAGKNDSSKPVPEETSPKPSTLSPGPTKILPLSGSGKDGQPRSVVGSNPDIPSTATREERSCSSSQSHNNSQSCSSDHTRTTRKEDARSSTARSISVNKVSNGSSRPRRSVNARPVSVPSGNACETGSNRNSLSCRNSASERLSQSGLTCEKVPDVSTIEGSSHNLPVEDAAVMNSRVSSPVLPEKNDLSDPNSKEKDDKKTTSDVKTESWQSSDFKDILTGSDEGDASPDVMHRNGDDDVKLTEISNVASQSLGYEMKFGKLEDASCSSINALVESCVKYAQADAPMFDGDDCGMNLLASVAAGEISKVNMPSPDGSSGGTSNITDKSVSGFENGSKATDGDELVREQLRSEDGLHGAVKQGNSTSVRPETAATEDAHDSLKLDSERDVNTGPQINDRSDAAKDISSVSVSPICAEGNMLIHHQSMQLDEKDESKTEATKLNESNDLNDVPSCLEVRREASLGVRSNASFDADSEKKTDIGEDNKYDCYKEQKQSLEVKPDAREACDVLSNDFPSKSTDKLDGLKLENKDVKNLNARNASFNEGHVGKITCDVGDDSKESESSATKAAVKTSHVNKKPKFDLNEFSSDDVKFGDPIVNPSTFPVSSHIVKPFTVPVASTSITFPASITVAAAAKGHLFPSMDLFKSKSEFGWKGSASTSAFRPVAPRKQKRPVFDFDLNVADEGIFDDAPSQNLAHVTTSTSPKKSLVPPLRCSVGFDLDLNQVDENSDILRGGLDLNNGPVLDEAVESSYNKDTKRNMQPQPFLTGLRTNTNETRILSSWLPTSAYSPITVPSILSGGGCDQPFPNGPPRVLGPIPSVPFSSFQYPAFSYGTGFSLPSTATVSGVSTTYTDTLSNARLGFSASNTQLLSGPQAVTSHFPRPYVFNPLDGGNITNMSNNSKWDRSGLDLNAGPGSSENDGRDAPSHLVTKQLSVANPQALGDEQGRMFQQVTGGILKRKDYTNDFRYKHSS